LYSGCSVFEFCREKVFIEKTRPFITLQGIGQPTIVWNDTNFLSGNHTFDSATFGVAGNFFLARNITFQVSTYQKYGHRLS
jgi:pectinesterase